MIQIIGAGAIGCLWLAKLLQSNQRSHIVSRSKNIEKILSFTNHFGELKQLPISHSHRLLHSNSIEQKSIILVCVKAQHVLNALLMQQEYISQTQPIILMHNGYGCAEQVIKYFPHNPIIMATTSNASLLNAPFNISHTGCGPTFLGAFNGSVQSNSSLIFPFQEAMPDVHWSEHIIEKCWLKLAINAVINPLTAINKIRNGQLVESKYAVIIEQLILEIYSIIKAEEINLSLNSLQHTIALVIEATAENYSSMNRDVYYNRETEIEFINGYLLIRAQFHNIKTPELNAYYLKIKALSTTI